MSPHRALLGLIAITAVSAGFGCTSGADDSGPSVEKGDEIDRLCELAGLPEDCDICAEQGWLGDGTCDDFCATPDPDCAMESEHEPNPACDERLDQWMFDCIERNLEDVPLDEAIDFCEGGALDGEPLEIEGICEDEDCMIDLGENAEACAAAIGEEFAPREPNPACDERLDQWMFDCIELNLEDVPLDEAIHFCEGGALDGEPLEIEGICEDEDCLIDLGENAEDCAAAVGAEFESRDDA